MAGACGAGLMTLDVARVKKDFPILDRDMAGHRLVFLDSAASSQKPRAVLDAMDHYYATTHANVHRGVYTIAEEATQAYEAARSKVARFIGAPSPRGVVFTKNATEAINLVAHSYGRSLPRPRARPCSSPRWSTTPTWCPGSCCGRSRASSCASCRSTTPAGSSSTTSTACSTVSGLVSVTAMSNVLGTLNPVAEIAAAAHAAGAVVLVDAAQSVPHVVTDVAAMGCDFLAFSAHKMCGPTGIGVLWGREDLLEAMPAFLGGGEMIRDVRLDGWTPNEIPWKFEAGTPPIAEAVGPGRGDRLPVRPGHGGRPRARGRPHRATPWPRSTERHGDDLRIFGPPDAHDRGGVLSFTYRDIHPHDLSQVLDSAGVCIRAGHHCARPLMRRLGVPATSRASFYVYNDEADVDALSDGLLAAADLFAI